MRGPKAFSDLIETIYDAALEPERWNDVVAQVNAYVGGKACGLFSKHAISKYGVTHYHCGADPHYIQLYSDTHCQFDPLTTLPRFGEVVSIPDLVPYDEYRHGRFYQEWLSPQGCVDAANVVLEQSTPHCPVLMTVLSVAAAYGGELETLADQFNDMAGRLEESYAGLEQKVEQRTEELARSVSELQALGEVSQAVNSTLDLETVLTTIVQRAVQLSHTDAGAIYVFDEERQEFKLRATYGMTDDMIVAITDRKIGTGDAHIGPAAMQRKPVQVADIEQEPPSRINEINLREGYRALLIVPLLRPGHITGALVVRRKERGEFPKSTIDLLETFGDQSVVAINPTTPASWARCRPAIWSRSAPTATTRAAYSSSLAASSRRSTSGSEIAFGRLSPDPGGVTAAAGSSLVTPSSARKACSRRTATRVRDAELAASGRWSASPSRRWRRNAVTSSRPTPVGSSMPRPARNSTHRRASRR